MYCTLQQKIEILDIVKSNTVSKLAAEYDIGNFTITDLKKKCGALGCSVLVMVSSEVPDSPLKCCMVRYMYTLNYCPWHKRISQSYTFHQHNVNANPLWACD